MILEQETFEKYGYKPSKLLPMSNKSVLIECDYCKIVAIRRFADLNLTDKRCQTTSCASKKCNIEKRKDIAKIQYRKTHPKIGDKFGRFTVISETKPNKDKKINGWYYFVTCQCECGIIKDIQLRDLRRKTRPIKSCGCLKRDKLIKRMTTHGKTKTPLHKVWGCMRDRCNNPRNSRYKYYGGKGVRVCDEWNNFLNFEKWAICNHYQKGLFIDRIDSDKNYCPENCEWITAKESGIRVGISTRKKKQQILEENKRLKDRIIELEKLLSNKNFPVF